MTVPAHCEIFLCVILPVLYCDFRGVCLGECTWTSPVAGSEGGWLKGHLESLMGPSPFHGDSGPDTQHTFCPEAGPASTTVHCPDSTGASLEGNICGSLGWGTLFRKSRIFWKLCPCLKLFISKESFRYIRKLCTILLCTKLIPQAKNEHVKCL